MTLAGLHRHVAAAASAPGTSAASATRGEVGDVDAAGERRRPRPRDLDRHAGLADPSRPGQGHQPPVVEHADQRVDEIASRPTVGVSGGAGAAAARDTSCARIAPSSSRSAGRAAARAPRRADVGPRGRRTAPRRGVRRRTALASAAPRAVPARARGRRALDSAAPRPGRSSWSSRRCGPRSRPSAAPRAGRSRAARTSRRAGRTRRRRARARARRSSVQRRRPARPPPTPDAPARSSASNRSASSSPAPTRSR